MDLGLKGINGITNILAFARVSDTLINGLPIGHSK